jgi:hypothetical protein
MAKMTLKEREKVMCDLHQWLRATYRLPLEEVAVIAAMYAGSIIGTMSAEQDTVETSTKLLGGILKVTAQEWFETSQRVNEEEGTIVQGPWDGGRKH